jgi:20S proteasome subunit beta 3
MIGCINWAKDFVVSGTASEKLYGMAEGLWEPDLWVMKGAYGGEWTLMQRRSEPEDLFETISQTLLNAVDWDAYSGWGAMVTIMCVFSVH